MHGWYKENQSAQISTCNLQNGDDCFLNQDRFNACVFFISENIFDFRLKIVRRYITLTQKAIEAKM